MVSSLGTEEVELEVRTDPPALYGLTQQLDHILALHTTTLEALGPAHEAGGRQAVLVAGEGEGEAQGQTRVLQAMTLHELMNALHDVVKQL